MKKPSSFIITIPQPCAENWDEMTPADKGRFCGACQKTVIDFTNCTDAEIIKMMEANSGPVCGRYNQWQLNRELILPQTQSFGKVLLSRIAASLLFFQAIVTTTWSQTVKPETHQSAKKYIPATKERSVTGLVLDEMSHAPLAQMIVQIDGTDIIDTTGKTGHFHLHLPENFNEKSVSITARYAVGSGPDGSSMPSQRVTFDLDGSAYIVLYRYTQRALNDLYAVQGRMSGTYTGGARTPGTLYFTVDSSSVLASPDEVQPVIPKRTFWQRITTPFRRNK